MTNKLFVGSISWNTSEQTLHDLFSEFGQVQSVSIIMDKYTGKSKGFGFVEMSSDQEAQAAMTGLNGRDVDGRPLAVSEAKPQAPRENNRYDNNRGNNRNDDRRGGNRY